jgi:ABC-2 type transport system ATP-binding protein
LNRAEKNKERLAMHMIEAIGLARTFRSRQGTVEAVRGVDFTVEAGEIVGFLGPNGAGKTTTLRMLTTLLNPTAGSATVAGCDLRRDPAGVRRRIGYVAQGGCTYPTCEVGEELELQAQLYRIGTAEARSRVTELCNHLDLAGLEERQVKTLSGGQRRRLDIALGLVHRPPLIFLDEPTAGLDPQGRSNLWGHVRKLRDEHNVAIFLTTHYMDEADALCDRILIIDHGRIVAEGTPEQLKRRIAGDIVTVEVIGPADRAQAVLTGYPGVREVVVADQTVRLTVEHGDQALMGLLRTLDAAKVELASIHHARPTLDDVFLTLTGRSLREDAPATTAS